MSTEIVPQEINVVYSDGTDEIAGVEPYMREVAAQVQSWARTATDTGVGSMIDRRGWEQSDNPIKHIRQAKRLLATSDLVAGFAELMEGLAFDGVKWESSDPDVADLFNQMAAEQNLDAVVRKAYRELFTTSQVITATWWDQGTFVVRGKTDKGNARKKTFKVWYPRFVSILDSERVVPVGMLTFGQEMLAWQASKDEFAAFKAYSRDALPGDEVVRRFFLQQYVPGTAERAELTRLGVDVEHLILLDPQLVRRHTLTRSDYERWAPVRLRPLFPLHDLRQQLMEADRVALIGAANYILLVKKGDKDTPAKQEEVNNVKAGFRTLAKVPVIFSDHRLSIEIVTPKQDYTLAAEKYDLLDSRIIQRLVNTVAGQRSRNGGGGEATLGKAVVRSLQNQRHMLRRFLELTLAREVVRDPKNEAAFKDFAGAPSLIYTPANIAMGDEAAVAQQILNLRTMREVSRESTLEYFGLDQEAEALRMELEAKVYDDTFKSQVPFSANPNQPQGDGQQQDQGDGKAPVEQAPAGARGGRPKGGGQRTQNPTDSGVTDAGNSSTKGK